MEGPVWSGDTQRVVLTIRYRCGWRRAGRWLDASCRNLGDVPGCRCTQVPDPNIQTKMIPDSSLLASSLECARCLEWCRVGGLLRKCDSCDHFACLPEACFQSHCRKFGLFCWVGLGVLSCFVLCCVFLRCVALCCCGPSPIRGSD